MFLQGSYLFSAINRLNFLYTVYWKEEFPENHFLQIFEEDVKQMQWIEWRLIFRSSHQRCSIKKYVLRNFTKLTGEHLCQSLFFNKFIKKETLAQMFPCKFCVICKNTFFAEHLWMTAPVFSLLSYVVLDYYFEYIILSLVQLKK